MTDQGKRLESWLAVRDRLRPKMVVHVPYSGAAVRDLLFAGMVGASLATIAIGVAFGYATTIYYCARMPVDGIGRFLMGAGYGQ